MWCSLLISFFLGKLSYYNIWAKGIDLSITETLKKNTDIKTFTNMEIYGELFFLKCDNKSYMLSNLKHPKKDANFPRNDILHAFSRYKP